MRDSNAMSPDSNTDPTQNSSSDPRRLRTIDAHTAGEPLRLIVDGFPPVQGRTILEQRDFAREHYDHLRRALMHEPRGHADMYGALLTPPEHEGSHAGILFMHNEGFSTMCGHGMIAVATILIERGMMDLPREADGSVRLTLDAPAGQIRTRARMDAARVAAVSFRNVPSFVLHPAVPVKLGTREIRADVAFGGAFYAIVDSEAVGIPILPERLADLRRIGMDIKHAVETAVTVAHPLEPGLHGIYGTIFTGPPHHERADLRNVTVFADAEVDRSPCGSGTAAVMAVLSAMGMFVEPDQVFAHESIIGTLFRGRVAERTTLPIPNSTTPDSRLEAIVPEIEGEAYIIGESTFIIDERDPLKYGFRL
ncbi:MAG TPA: proline racemase family protein [Vicinamibacterales bacterium]|nr:proline racemase family protein [Vicinamibacterales bacterium]